MSFQTAITRSILRHVYEKAAVQYFNTETQTSPSN